TALLDSLLPVQARDGAHRQLALGQVERGRLEAANPLQVAAAQARLRLGRAGNAGLQVLRVRAGHAHPLHLLEPSPAMRVERYAGQAASGVDRDPEPGCRRDGEVDVVLAGDEGEEDVRPAP